MTGPGRPPLSPTTRRARAAAVVGVVVVLAVADVAVLAALAARPALSTPAPAPTARPGPTTGTSRAPSVPTPAPAAVRTTEPDRTWVLAVSSRTGIPTRALRAYAAAELRTAAADPACRVTWTTLAAIGWVESRHGTIGGTHLEADGRSVPRITGPALTGTRGIADIDDTDGGALDGDPVHDRAVGPMQFLPDTWVRLGTDGDGDGSADPDDLDDAAAAAADHLCDTGVGLDTGAAWTRAVLGYNRSDAYLRQVHAVADVYATRSRR